MNREIKFRGMSLNGEWYYGLLSYISKKVDHIESGYYISNKAGMPFAYAIRPETIGQYTGFKDKNGKEIYEGDIVHIFGQDAWENDWDYKETIEHIGQCYSSYGIGNAIDAKMSAEVIGNIYPNPELLTTV